MSSLKRSERYQKVVENLESRVVMPDRPPSLMPTLKGLELIGFEKFPLATMLKSDPLRCVIVAGTNGKGSVCASLEALFTSTGETVGLYTSPHLIESSERIRFAGQDISQEHFSATFDAVDEVTKELELSHFETVTLMAIWYLGSGKLVKPVDRLILEVGLGGTWDSTNAVPHGACVITRLGLDHQNILGRRMLDIAANKFGVVSPKALVVHAPLESSIRELALKIRTETASRWIEAESFPFEVIKNSEEEPVYVLETPWGETPIKLVGPRGAENTTLALTLFESLGFDPKKHLKSLEKVSWPGRMERLENYKGQGRLYLSGDHNPQGVQSLLALLPDYRRAHLHLLVGIGADKNADGILAPLTELKETSLYLTETPFRGRTIESYGPWLKKAAAYDKDPEKVLKKLLSHMKEGDMAVVTGSLYLVGLIKNLFL